VDLAGAPDLGPGVAPPPSTAWTSEGGGSVSAGGLQIDFTIAGSVVTGSVAAGGGASVNVGGICSAVE
jgi:hypothetical protein